MIAISNFNGPDLLRRPPALAHARRLVSLPRYSGEGPGWGLLLALWCLPFCAVPARAGIFYSFDPSLPPGQVKQVDVGAGSKTTLTVYLVFTAADAPQVSAAAGGKGLYSADVQLLRQGTIPANPADPVGILSSADVAPNSIFDGFTNTSRISAADVDLFQSVSPAASIGALASPASPASPDTQILLLGKVTFTADNSPGASATFRAQDLAGFDDTVTFSDTQGIVLDSMIAPADVTFTIVPEPGIAAPALCFLLWGLRRTRVLTAHRLSPPGRADATRGRHRRRASS